MAVIRPFSGLRYTSQAGSLDKVTAPPYDVLTPTERDAFAARSPYNIVHLTLPRQEDDDRSKFVKYARSAAAMAEWRREGIIAPEAAPSFYRYTQRFNLPFQGGSFTRTSIIALIKVEPYEKGIVLPHEQTFPKHKEDRLRILEATHAHLECIFGLFEDSDTTIHHAIVDAPAETGASCHSDDGTDQLLEPITDPAAIKKLVDLMADRKVWIADGHHRYETACAFRESCGKKEGLVAEDFMMMALASMNDPGLVLMPTHRIMKTLPLTVPAAIEKLQENFSMEQTHETRLTTALEQGAKDGVQTFGVAVGGGNAYILRPKAGTSIPPAPSEGSADLRTLDVSILHDVILRDVLGVHGLDTIEYTRDPFWACKSVDEGAAMAFLMNPPSVDDMRRIALGGEKMPQKSTYYYPKILSGIVMWSLNDF